ncbi:zinc finger protein 334, isoform CRA_d [Homo sapiens]|nr:zinc finger protein 334, isoform CRA_d [Homo sapiens]
MKMKKFQTWMKPHTMRCGTSFLRGQMVEPDDATWKCAQVNSPWVNLE